MATPLLFLSEHAEERVRERTRMAPEEVTRAINALPMIFTGYQCEDNRVHIVFYSPLDYCCFFAVANLRDGAVATVLTLAQYRDRYGAVDAQRMEQAEVRALGSGVEREHLLLACRYITSAGIARMRNLGRVSGYPPGIAPEALANDTAFVALVRARCEAKGVDFGSVLNVQVRPTQEAPGIEVPLALPGADAMLHQRWQDPTAQNTDSP